MNDKIKVSFDQIHADELLKEKTKANITSQMKKRMVRRRPIYISLIPVAACILFALVCFGGYEVYFTEVYRISMDINPSMELGINRFDKVVSVQGYNDDGAELAEKVDVRFMEYTDAVNKIVESEDIIELLKQNEMMSIDVIGNDAKKTEKMLANVEKCTSHHQNIDCRKGNLEQVEEAHEAGMSCGKYRVYQELQELDPKITIDEVQGMTMREVRDRIESLSKENSDKDLERNSETEGHHGDGQHEDEHHDFENSEKKRKHGAGE